MEVNLKKGSEIRKILKRKGLSSADICRALGLHKTTVSRYFTDDVKKIPLQFLINVAKLAEMSVEEFTEGYRPEQIFEAPKASEPPVIYRIEENPEQPGRKLIPLSPPSEEKAVITLDISVLEAKLGELYKMMHEVQDEIRHIKEEIHTVNH